ncbi:MAG: hypothetical protein ACRDQ7_03365 [Haloechinothrix sp.]
MNTDPQQPPFRPILPPEGQQPTPPPQPQRQARATRWPWMLGIVAAMLLGVGVGAISVGADKPTSPGTVPTTEGDEPVADIPEPEPDPVTLPEPEDFEVGIKVLEKQCFGSAGCHITFRIEPSYLGINPIPDDQTISVIYEVKGGSDGPQINTFTITGDTASFDAEEFLSTDSSSVTLTAAATDVFE